MLSPLDELLWALIGLLLTIGGIFIEVAIPLPQWPLVISQDMSENLDLLQAYPLGVSFQIGAVLLVGCLGGKNAAALSQVAYLLLGLSGFQVFAQGGGLQYLQEPTFGYLLGFLPGAWLCGYLAFRKPPGIESLGLSCLSGLVAIHATGLLYLVGLAVVDLLPDSWLQAAWQYSVHPLPGQLVVVCAIILLSLVLRRVLFY